MTLAALDRETLGYGRAAVLPGLSFALAPGERVVLLGRSGVGKTTVAVNLAVYLAGATFTTGQACCIDGGWTL